jgi:hypothetical protein
MSTYIERLKQSQAMKFSLDGLTSIVECTTRFMFMIFNERFVHTNKCLLSVHLECNRYGET